MGKYGCQFNSPKKAKKFHFPKKLEFHFDFVKLAAGV